jgi:hypothetical protein
MLSIAFYLREASMRKLSPLALSLCLLAIVPCARTQRQDDSGENAYYVFNGKTLEIANDNPAYAKHTRWQVWFYPKGVRIPRHTAGLQYSRWGLMEETSAGRVLKRLKAAQRFEEAYLKFFGPDTWGRYTFLNSLGPIAVAEQSSETRSTKAQFAETQPPDLEELYELRRLDDRLDRLTTTAEPSLENNESEGPSSPVKAYFDQIRDALQRVSKLSSQLARVHPQLQFIKLEIVKVQPEIGQAEKDASKITAVLPSVKLPSSTVWMSQKENAGRDGIKEIAITEIGSGVSVQEKWTGGDGSMSGTIILTAIPYDDIGTIDLVPPMPAYDDTWTVRVHAGRAPFPQKIDSPQRRTIKATFPAVNYTTAENSVYFVFSNSPDAQDAYAYFLYHKQLGR